MKKLFVIIGVLAIIFFGMVIYKNTANKSNVTVQEVENIEKYISKIYMWKEVTEEALPEFNNINEAPDLWTWEVVKKNLEDYELTYEEIQQKATELFGKQFTKQFPKEGTEYIKYDEQTDKYITSGIGLDSLDDCFLIKNINKNKNEYDVEIVEYLEDYSNSAGVEDEDEVYDIYIKNLNQDTIATIKSNEGETKAIETVKENIDKFTTKTITLIKDSDGNIYVKQVEQGGQK